jgi:hypothetical protein
VLIEGRTVTMGLAASGKIWVYDPKDPPETGGRRSSRAKRARSAAR